MLPMIMIQMYPDRCMRRSRNFQVIFLGFFSCFFYFGIFLGPDLELDAFELQTLVNGVFKKGIRIERWLFWFEFGEF